MKLPRIAVLASGQGSNFEALVEASRDGRLQAEIVGLIASRPGIVALERAARLNIPSAVIHRKSYSQASDWDQALLKTLQSWRAEWVALAGFLSLIGPQTLGAFPKRIVNVHPSLLPAFGGPGMYGDRVHAAVIAEGARQSGVTVHLVDAEYDQGAILSQVAVDVTEGDTADTLAARIRDLEHRHYPKVLNDLVWGRLTDRKPSSSP